MRVQVMAVWDFEAAVERRNATGGTAKSSVLEQAKKLEAWATGKDSGASPASGKRKR
jgi:argininosuccinate lyase